MGWGSSTGRAGGRKVRSLPPKCPPFENSGKTNFLFGVKFPGPFLAGNCAEKPQMWVLIWKWGSEDFHRKRGKITENRASINVNRRYFGVDR